MKFRATLSRALGAALAALAAAAIQTAASDISIIGKWQIVEAVPAPWAAPGDQGTPLDAPGPFPRGRPEFPPPS